MQGSLLFGITPGPFHAWECPVLLPTPCSWLQTGRFWRSLAGTVPWESKYCSFPVAYSEFKGVRLPVRLVFELWNPVVKYLYPG